MENAMVIKKDLSVIDYVLLVDNIVNEFFDEDGEYTPHIGRLNTMRLFYNECVVESKFDLPHDFKDALLMDVLVEDEEFIKEFNNAIKGDNMVHLDFANAYAEAMEIVRTKKDSFNGMANTLKIAINGVMKILNPILSEDMISKLSEIADSMSNGNFGTESIVDAYKKISEIKNITNEK